MTAQACIHARLGYLAGTWPDLPEVQLAKWCSEFCRPLRIKPRAASASAAGICRATHFQRGRLQALEGGHSRDGVGCRSPAVCDQGCGP